jgi:extracellular elastinolytic metalloproteinase
LYPSPQINIFNMRGLLLAGALALPASVFAHPAHQTYGLNRRTVDLNAFRLKSLAKYVNATEAVIEAPSSFAPFKQQSYVEAATQHVKMTAPDATFRVVDDHYVGDNGVAHVHFRQTANGLDIDNADFNVNVRIIQAVYISC